MTMVFWKGVGASVLMVLSIPILFMLGIFKEEVLFPCIYASALVLAVSLADDR